MKLSLFLCERQASLLFCLIQSPRALPVCQLGSCSCSCSACFEFIDRTNPLVHLGGSEYAAFPEIGIRNALTALTALTCADGLARSRVVHGPMHGEVCWGDTVDQCTR